MTLSTFNFVLVAWRAPAACRFLSSLIWLQMIHFGIDESVDDREDEEQNFGE